MEIAVSNFCLLSGVNLYRSTGQLYNRTGQVNSPAFAKSTVHEFGHAAIFRCTIGDFDFLFFFEL